MTKDEAIHKALKVLNCLNNDRVYETAWVKGAINACEEALEQKEIGDAEIKQMLNDIEWYQMLVKELESELEAIAQHQILEAISSDVAKQQKDKQFYQSSLVDMVEQPVQGMKAVSYPKDNKWIDMVEQPTRLVSYAPDKSTCTLNIDGEEVYFNREQPAQEPKCSNHPDAPHGFCRDASHSAGRYVCECEGWEAEQLAPSWQGLSDDELDEIVDSLNVSLILDCSIADFVNAIEAKLKEKNYETT